MIVVTIELWPGGDRERKKPLGGLIIENDGTGTGGLGNYKVYALHGGRYFGKEGIWKKGKVQGFLRKLSPYRLVARALQAVGEV
jgi:hypothetical protein